ncbi:type IV secretory system conjugative DNA transfer family protein [Aliivibrio fischeri]
MNKKIVFLLCIPPICIGIALYLSGIIYFMIHSANTEIVTPYTIIEQWIYYSEDMRYQKSLVTALLIGFGIAVIAPTLLFLFNTKEKEELHGSARFATQDEIKKEGLTNNNGKGILIGQFNGFLGFFKTYLYFNSDSFILLIAPTRSGKGVGVVIPNLLVYNQSMVILDLKQENFSITSKYRAKYGQQVFLFNPFTENGQTHRYNPLGYVREGDCKIGDILTITTSFYPIDDPKNSFWNDQASNLFLGLALMVSETPSLPFTIGELLRQSSGKGKPLKEYLQGIMDDREKSSSPLSESCIDALNRFIALTDNSLSNVLASFNAPLKLWANPLFDAATSANDFDLRELRKKKMTVYIGITPDYLEQAERILNLFFSQLINLNTKELPEHNPELKYQCLLVMDEFTAMGRIGILAKSVSYMAGYGLRLLTIIQAPSQLDSVYGKEEARTYKTNHAGQILFAPRENEDAEEYSKAIGYKTVKAKSNSKTRGELKQTDSTSDQRRAVMLPQEIKEIGMWKEIICIENLKPIFCKKVQYFNDPVFIDRLKEVSSSLKSIEGIPTRDQLKNAITNKELQIEIPTLERIDSKPTPTLFDSPLNQPLPLSDHDIAPVQEEVETEEKYDESLLTTSYDDSDIPDFI